MGISGIEITWAIWAMQIHERSGYIIHIIMIQKPQQLVYRWYYIDIYFIYWYNDNPFFPQQKPLNRAAFRHGPYAYLCVSMRTDRTEDFSDPPPRAH